MQSISDIKSQSKNESKNASKPKPKNQVADSFMDFKHRRYIETTK